MIFTYYLSLNFNGFLLQLHFSREIKKEEMLVLDDIKFEDLKSLMVFMYNGQVTVPKDRLRDFVRAAESLQIRGLPSDLVKNSLREETEISVVCRKKGLASQLSRKRMKCSAISGESSDVQCESSIGKKHMGDERPSTCMQMDVSKENVFPQPILERDHNKERAVFPAEKEPSVVLEEEVNVEDTPIWEREDKNTSAVTDVSSASAAKEIQNSASSSLSVRSVPSAQGGSALEDSSFCVEAELSEQRICVKNESVLKTEGIPALANLQSESILEPMHEVWVKEEVRSSEDEDEINEADSTDTCYQKPANWDLEIAASVPDKQSAVLSNCTFKSFVSSCVGAQRDKKEVNAQGKEEEETKIDEGCIELQNKCIDINDSTVDKVVESGQRSIIDIDEDNAEMEGQEMMENVEQNETEEDPALLSESISKMLGKKSYRCFRCPDVFHTLSDLRLHVKNLHEEELPNRCELSTANFAIMSELTRHTGERPFQCDICKMSFIRMSHLTVHKRKHTGERPFQCDVCTMSFSDKSAFTRHKRTHNGERPYQCDVCKRSFSLVNTLNIHKRRHTGERPFQCEMCGRSFSQMPHLTRHKRMHTGERPFQCDVCSMSFSERSTLTNHKRTHTGERPFQCDVCERSFSLLSTLTTHKRKHAGVALLPV